MYGKNFCVCPANLEDVKYIRKSQLYCYLKDTVNEGHIRNDLHTKDKFDHQNGLCYCVNTCFISEEWTITLQ